MVAQNVVPTMSTDGWVVGVKQRVDRLFAYWLANEKSQSYLAPDNIISFQYDIQQHGSNGEYLATIAATHLENYLAAHFDKATVIGMVKWPYGESNPHYHVEFDVKVSDGDIGYDIGRTLLEIIDGIFRGIIEGL